MAKILLVEDDNNLREIYEARLQAEGYTIVSARDGEEALVVAKAEMPDLVISDVMMPKISGFEMLDILRDTETLRDVKVIMLTALGQAEDQTRADKLGADRYLVKSQVTLEDIVNVAGELLNVGSAAPEGPAAAAAAPPEPAAAAAAPEPAAATQPTPTAQPVAEPVADAPQPVTPVEPAAAESVPAPVEPEVAPPAVSSQPTEATAAADVQAQIDSFAAAPASAPLTVDPVTAAQDKALQDAITDLGGSDDEPVAAEPTPAPEPVTPVEPPAPAPAPASEAPVAASAPDEAKSEYVAGVSGKKIIAPLDHDQEDKKSLDQLLAEEEAKESGLGIPTASGSAPAPEGGTASNLPAVDPAILANTNANRPKDDEAEAAAILAQAKTAADPTAEVSPAIQPEAAQTPAAAPAEEDKPIDPSSVAL
ncbi:MAG TPA: response regulator, partial [Candidatus Saccharibacteria bacterium]|nr:response regulator [Candidatus Saccharibacteria bacterium]